MLLLVLYYSLVFILLWNDPVVSFCFILAELSIVWQWSFNTTNSSLVMTFLICCFRSLNMSVLWELREDHVSVHSYKDIKHEWIRHYHEAESNIECICHWPIWFWNIELVNNGVLLIISPVSEGSGDVMVLRRSRPPPAVRRPPPAARNGVNAITQKPLDGLFSNLVYTLVVIVSWPD